jgi:hypothetical protein
MNNQNLLLFCLVDLIDLIHRAYFDISWIMFTYLYIYYDGKKTGEILQLKRTI